MNWYLQAVLKKYADFGGRARREEFWMFVAVNIGIGIAVGVVAVIIHFWFLSTIYSLALLIPSLAVSVRRLHDTDRSGWWLLIGLVPLIGLIVLIIFYVQDGSAGDNKYGPSPKAAAA